MNAKKSDNAKTTSAPVAYMAMPRPWLIGLVLFLIIPWLAIAAIWFKPKSKASADDKATINVKESRSGKWGNLTLIPIVIAPPMELVFTDWGLNRQPVWFFPNANADAVSQMLQSAGVSADTASGLCAHARPEPGISGVVLSPDPSWVRQLNPETRARIYRELVKSGLNVDQTQAFRFLGSNPDAWFGDMISPETRQLIDPLIYRDGACMLLSDIELVRNEIGGEEEMRRLGKALFRQPTVIAQLSVDPGSDIDALVEYWGRGGRRTEIRPLIESIVGGGYGRFIDIIHLLPPFAKDHLYNYPQLSAADLNRPMVVNCLWTSLNFFSQKPDDRYLDGAFALKTLKENYFIVESDFELGDIVAFLDEKGDFFHAAVYVADDLVFSKNGISAMAPWTLMTMDEVKSYYRWRSENPRILVHRRKDL
jgi:hypothetical protein